MTKEELIRNLKYTMEKHKNDNVDTFGTNISLMCKDVLDYLEQLSDDCVSRADLLKEYENRFIELQKAHQTDKQLGVNWCINTLKDMPPVTPTHGTCKDCAIKQLDKSESVEVGTEKYYCPIVSRYVDETPSFYCADFKKRGSENEMYRL